MSRFVRHLLCTAIAISACAGAAGAQLLGQLSLPPVGLPAPVGSVPVAGPVLQDVLGSPQVQQQVIRPTLDAVQGLPQAVAESGGSTLAELRKMRLQELIRENRNVLEADDRGQPARRGVLIAVDPDPASLQLAARAGFVIASQDFEPALGMRVVTLAVPARMNLREAIRRLRTAAPQLQVDYDHVFEPAGGSLVPLAATLASVAGAGNGHVVGMIDGGVASHPSLAGASEAGTRFPRFATTIAWDTAGVGVTPSSSVATRTSTPRATRTSSAVRVAGSLRACVSRPRNSGPS